MLQKKALQVSSWQIFDLILPDFDVLKELSAAGGGMDDLAEFASGAAENLNPFARKVKDPVVYWSGIVDVNTNLQSQEFEIPDYFDGTLRVMAVAVSDNQFAHAQEKVVVRGPFIVTPNVPLVVAPGDEFEVTVGVSNQLEDSGNNLPLTVELATSEHITLLGEGTRAIELSEGDETSLRFKLKATENLGSADVRFIAKANNQAASRKADSTLSVRPAMPKNLSLKSGRFNDKEKTLELNRELIERYAEAKIQVSNNPSLIVDGLISYLSVYPHACTEQIVSQVMPLVAFAKHPSYLGKPATKIQQLNSLFSSLQQRQLSNGGFTLWPGGNHAIQVPSIHTMHLLLEARDENLEVPKYLLENGLEYLEEVAYDVDMMRRNPELAAYALYLLTASGEVTGSSLAQLESVLDASPETAISWKQQLVGAYIATSYQLLKKEDYATKLMRQYKFRNARTKINRYDSTLYRDAMAMYLLAKYFPSEFDKEDTQRIEALIEPVLSGNINTMSSGRTLMALNAYAKLFDGDDITQSIKVAINKIGDAQWREIELEKENADALYASAELEYNDAQIRIQNLDATQLYYQTIQNGFDRRPPSQASSNGLSVEKRILDDAGEELKTKFSQGEDVIIELRIRSTDNESHNDIAMIDLVPGGFEVDLEASRNMTNSNAEYIDIREDRFVFYGRVRAGQTVTVRYKARISTSGKFVVPPVYANAMYDEDINAHSAAGSVLVSAGK